MGNAAPDNPTRHNPWECYPFNAIPPNPITRNAWEFYPNNYATGNPTPYNVWSYPWLDTKKENTIVYCVI